jgi:hypothetical protein
MASSPATPGYSGKSLVDKLGIKPGNRMALIDAPPEFPLGLGQLPDDVQVVGGGGKELDFILFFADRAQTLEQKMPRAIQRLQQAGMLWIAWPKKSSRVPTDITEDIVRRIALPLGVVDVKVCAITDVWSGLKLVRRLKNRS